MTAGSRRATVAAAIHLPLSAVAEALVRDPDGVAVNLVQTPKALSWLTTQRG